MSEVLDFTSRANHSRENATLQKSNLKWLRFFFADERLANGKTVGFDVSGESHVPVYLELVNDGDELPYYVTFAEGKYTKFDL